MALLVVIGIAIVGLLVYRLVAEGKKQPEDPAAAEVFKLRRFVTNLVLVLVAVGFLVAIFGWQ